MPYHEDPEFQSNVKKIEDALAWRVMSFIESSLNLLSQALGILLISSLFINIAWWILVAILVPVVVDYLINIYFGADMWGIWMSHGDEKKDADHALDGFKNREVVRESKIYGFGSYIASKYRKAYQSFTNTIVTRLNRKYLSLGASTIVGSVISLGVHIFLLMELLSRNIVLSQYSFLLGSLGTISGYFSTFQRHLASLYENGLYVFDLRNIFELPDIIDKTHSHVLVARHLQKLSFAMCHFLIPRAERRS